MKICAGAVFHSVYCKDLIIGEIKGTFFSGHAYCAMKVCKKLKDLSFQVFMAGVSQVMICLVLTPHSIISLLYHFRKMRNVLPPIFRVTEFCSGGCWSDWEREVCQYISDTFCPLNRISICQNQVQSPWKWRKHIPNSSETFEVIVLCGRRTRRP
jgi:hypothetical protein